MGMIKESSLINEARLLLEVRKYHLDNVQDNGSSIDIVASKPNTGKTFLIKIITKSELNSGTISIKQVREMKTTLDGHNFDAIIVFGDKFTSAAEKELAQKGYEYFTRNQIFSTFDPQMLYTRIIDCVDDLCKAKCGFIPKSENECDGFSRYTKKCSICDGNGTISGSPDIYWKQRCPVCGGTGLKTNHYSCKYRLISDNADYHFKQKWISLLQNDLRSLLEDPINQKTEDLLDKLESQ